MNQIKLELKIIYKKLKHLYQNYNILVIVNKLY